MSSNWKVQEDTFNDCTFYQVYKKDGDKKIYFRRLYDTREEAQKIVKKLDEIDITKRKLKGITNEKEN